MSVFDPKRSCQGKHVAEIIARRPLQYSAKGESRRHDIEVRVYSPHALVEGTVSFDFPAGAAGCRYEIVGLPQAIDEVVYGVDSLQALQLASDVEPRLRALQRKYDLYFRTGEPYFED